MSERPRGPDAAASPHRFRLGPSIGAGSFGEVVRAYDRELDTWVALKRAFRDDRTLRAEHRALAAVCHPNVVAAGVWIEGPEWSGYSMALAEGPDARAWVRGAERVRAESSPRRNLPMAFGQPLRDVGDSAYVLLDADRQGRLRHVLRDLAHALEAVHGARWLHLDVTPQNVHVVDGRAVLLDLGLAIPQGRSMDATAFAGTAAYGAPELGSRPPTPACDWYSLGVVAFELLLGDRPFEGGGPEVLVRKQSLAATPPSELVVGVPGDLDAACVGLLERMARRRMDGPTLRRTLEG